MIMPTGSRTVLMRMVVMTMIMAACTVTMAAMFFAFSKNIVGDDFLAGSEFFFERLFERPAIEISKRAA